MALFKCSECGNQVSDKAASCPKCGSPTTDEAPDASMDPEAQAPETPREEILLDEGGVKVTATLVTFPDRTYSTANINSVAIRTQDIVRPKSGAMFLGTIGAIILLLGFDALNTKAIIAGLIVGALGILWFTRLQTIHKYYLYLSDSNKESEAINSTNKDFIDRIAAALNAAVTKRG